MWASFWRGLLETLHLSTTTLWVPVPLSMQLAQLGAGMPCKQWCALGGVGSVRRVCLLYTRLCAVWAFVFIVSKIFFSPLQAAIALRCSAHLFSQEKNRGGCATCLFSILALWPWNLGPKKAGVRLLFQSNHMGQHVLSCVGALQSSRLTSRVLLVELMIFSSVKGGQHRSFPVQLLYCTTE